MQYDTTSYSSFALLQCAQKPDAHQRTIACQSMPRIERRATYGRSMRGSMSLACNSQKGRAPGDLGQMFAENLAFGS